MKVLSRRAEGCWNGDERHSLTMDFLGVRFLSPRDFSLIWACSCFSSNGRLAYDDADTFSCTCHRHSLSIGPFSLLAALDTLATFVRLAGLGSATTSLLVFRSQAPKAGLAVFLGFHSLSSSRATSGSCSSGGALGPTCRCWLSL